jgi:hypothetical protein
VNTARTGGGNDRLQPHQLQRHVGHGGQNAGQRDRQFQPAIAEPRGHHVGGRDLAAGEGIAPEPRVGGEQQHEGQHGVGHREKPDGAGGEHQGRDREEGVRGGEIAAEQEPGDDRAEAPPAQAPLVQQVEVAAAPVDRDEPEDGGRHEQRRADGQNRPPHAGGFRSSRPATPVSTAVSAIHSVCHA